MTGVLLILFGGVTDRLIPLYAVGAFLAFTLSQLGMVFHWKRVGGPHALRYMFINGLGGIVTGITVLVVLVAKFIDGAWITMLLIPGLLTLMYAVHRHYERVSLEVADSTPLDSPTFTRRWSSFHWNDGARWRKRRSHSHYPCHRMSSGCM